jgi:hypothetical protein
VSHLCQLTPMALAQILVGIAQQKKITPLKTKFDPSPWTPLPWANPQLLAKKTCTIQFLNQAPYPALAAHECLNPSIPKRRDRSVDGLLAGRLLLFAFFSAKSVIVLQSAHVCSHGSSAVLASRHSPRMQKPTVPSPSSLLFDL